MASGISSTTTRCSDDSTNAPTPSPGPLPSAESVSHVPGHSVSYVPGCSAIPAPARLGTDSRYHDNEEDGHDTERHQRECQQTNDQIPWLVAPVLCPVRIDSWLRPGVQ